MATLAGLHLFDVGDAAHRDAAATVEVGVPQATAHQHFATGGEVGARHQLQQLFIAEIGFADQGDQGIHHLPQVVGGDVGGHAHRDASAAIQQQERQLGRQHRGLLLGAIEIGAEIDGVVADFIEHRLVGDRCQPRFGVPHRRRWVVVHRAEVAVAIQQRIAAGEGLHQAHQGVVDGLIAVGMVFTQNIAHHAGALAIGPIWGQAQLVHREEDAPLHWFEPIAHIGQGSSHDHAHRVLEVGALHLLMQSDRLNPGILGLLDRALLGHPLLGSEG